MSFYDLNATFRPIDTWPGERTKNRIHAPFKASWSATLELLDKELRAIGAKKILCQVAVSERYIRQDGYPYANAVAAHPGVILAFESKYGPLKYACDRFEHWQDNVRAIALSLEALRKVDRYGITKRGEQYTGWKALPASFAEPVMTTEQAARFVVNAADALYTDREVLAQPDIYRNIYRTAAKNLHPDQGGDTTKFQKLQEAKRILDRHYNGKR